MSAIERCRTAALGGHVDRCEACAHVRVSYNSCRNRHCPKCQAVAAKEWLADRQAELLPVPYFHVVFTFIRRFLIHVLPDGFHRIRHYGLFANGYRADNIARARMLLGVPDATPSCTQGDGADCPQDEQWNTCPCCGGRMVIIEIFERGCQPRSAPTPTIGIDSS